MPFTGSLGTLPLPDILNTLHNIHATGVLQLESRVGSRDVIFQNGEIIGVGVLDQERSHALVRRMALLSQVTANKGPMDEASAEELRQEEALSQVFNLFAWHDATFSFIPATPEAADVQQLVAVSQLRPLNLNIQHVLMEAARQQDEWAALRARIQQESLGKSLRSLGPSSITHSSSSPAPAPDLPLAVPADEEWEKPLIRDEELAPTPWSGDAAGAPSGQTTGHGRSTARLRTGSSTFAKEAVTTTVGGAIVGPYRISGRLERLNGSAYRAKHVQERTEAALKLAPRELFPGDQGLTTALHEARLLAAVHHPNVLACLGTGEGGGGIYVAFEPHSGDELAQLVEKAGGPLPEADVVRLALDCAYGLQTLHHRGLTHRDLRPDNIFLTVEGRARLGPFALRYAPALDAPLPEPGQLVAAFSAFSAPEVVQGLIDVDHRADIYALAAILFFLSTGQPPYHGSTRADLARAILNRPAPNPRDLNRKISEALAQVLAAGLARSRAQRHQSIDAFIADLQVLDLALAPASLPFTDGDSSATNHPAASPTGVLRQPTRRASAITSMRRQTGQFPATSTATRRGTVRTTGVIRTPGETTVRRAIIPQPQPITAMIAQPPPEPSQAATRSWNLYDMVLVLLVVATVFYTVTAPGSASAGSPTTGNAQLLPDPQPAHDPIRLPRDGHRLLFSGDPWAEMTTEGAVTVGPDGAVFTGVGALRASEPLISRALIHAGDFSILVCFTAAKPALSGEGRLLAIARTPIIANFSVGQMGSALEVSCRTSATDAAGSQVTSPAGVITGQRQRLLFVRASGRHTLYLDGAPVAWAEVKGDLSTWDTGCMLILGRDPMGGSPWPGTLHDVTFWPRPLNQTDREKLELGIVKSDLSHDSPARPASGNPLLNPDKNISPAPTAVPTTETPCTPVTAPAAGLEKSDPLLPVTPVPAQAESVAPAEVRDAAAKPADSTEAVTTPQDADQPAVELQEEAE